MMLVTTSIQIWLILEWDKTFMTLDFCATQIGLEESWTCSSVLYGLLPNTSVAHPDVLLSVTLLAMLTGN